MGHVAKRWCGKWRAGTSTQTQKAQAHETSTQVQKRKVALEITAEGFDAETSTPFIAMFEGKNAAGDEVKLAHALAGEKDELELDAGEYELSFVPAVNADGSTYEIPAAQSVKIEDSANPYQVEFTLIAAVDVTEEVSAGVLQALVKVQGASDSSLSAEELSNIQEKASKNFAHEESASTEGKEDSAGENAAASGTNAGSTSSVRKTGTSSSSSGSSSSGAGSGTSSTTSAHVHEWETIYHEAVTHEEPVYEKVWVRSEVWCTVHQVPYSGRNCGADPDCMANTYGKEIYENQQTGTKTITDQAAYSEKVCAPCGAKG